MKLRDPRLWLALASLVAVAVLALRDWRHATSPGPLHPVHARERELHGRGSCAECHGRGDDAGGMAAACAECHEEVAAQRRDGRGLHGTLAAELRDACGRCHPEHLGDAFEPTGETVFAQAGLSRSEFDHSTVEFLLTGRHDDLGCKDCHPRAEADPLPAGQPRFLDRRQDCTSCHEDPHRGRMRRACEDCHGQEAKFEQVAAFRHDSRFPLVGGHAGRACTECHPKESLQSVEALDAGVPEDGWRDCRSCHDSPHAAPFLAAAAARRGLAEGTSCEACHPVEGPAFAEAELDPADHAGSGFPLSPPHARAACTDCHGEKDGQRTWRERFPGRAPDQCALCHEDPHRGQFAGGPFAGGCLECHDEQSWKPPLFDATRHERARFALTGAHRRAECADCHLDPPPGQPRRFRPLDRLCQDCHRDAHRGAFAARAAAAPPAGTCASCHGTEAFAPALAGSFDHGADASFALRGAHQRAECRACHPELPEPEAATGRTFAFVADRVEGDPRLCASCHEDVHRGAFDRPEAPAVPGGGVGCARCHDEESFRRLRTGAFDHGAWTGFALVGAHRQTDCAGCHGRSDQEPPPGGRSLGRVSDRFPGPAERCVTCHPDPHLGVFDRLGLPTAAEGAVGCARCHQPISFRALTLASFDHGRWTRFPLGGRHAEASCDACHPPLAGRTPTGRTHATARGLDCASCHDDPHVGQFAVAGRTNCARCHDDRAFQPARFDHQKDSRFPLDANHVRLDCEACHKPWPLRGGGSAIRYKPLGTRCQDCHSTGAGRPIR
ncbi:MAG: hypothetical protein D6702_06465 [Planctomycetota bacterium]|nr:MAG: hypothetical protein D6702_06465 [Planctomycetota bacterium]